MQGSTVASRHAAEPAPPAARAMGLTKVYGEGETAVAALRGVDVQFEAGRFTAIMGPSGSGKSTLMHCMAGLDSATAGKVFIGTADLTTMRDNELTKLRRERMGFVFQAFNLVPTLTAEENITLPIDIAGGKVNREWFDLVVGTIGLADRLTHRPSELSGGQQQRVACARAMVTRPEIIFADEPTGNLDSRSGAEVLGFLRRSVDEFGQTIVMVTHDAHAAAHADRVIFLADGEMVAELLSPDVTAILDLMKSFETGVSGRGRHARLGGQAGNGSDGAGPDGRARDGETTDGAGSDTPGPDSTGADSAGPDSAGPDSGPDGSAPAGAGPESAGPDSSAPAGASPGSPADRGGLG